MKQNMGIVDRILRVVVALVVGVLYAMHIISGTLALVLGVVALVFIATSVMGFCPLYLPLNLSTKGKK